MGGVSDKAQIPFGSTRQHDSFMCKRFWARQRAVLCCVVPSGIWALNCRIASNHRYLYYGKIITCGPVKVGKLWCSLQISPLHSPALHNRRIHIVKFGSKSLFPPFFPRPLSYSPPFPSPFLQSLRCHSLTFCALISFPELPTLSTNPATESETSTRCPIKMTSYAVLLKFL